MITYNELYELLRKERYSEELQNLPKNFLGDVSKYLKEKKEFSSKDDDVFSDVSMKNKKKLENAISIFRELLTRRRKKILNLAFVASMTGISKKDFENLLSFEKDLFEDLVKSLERSEKDLNGAMNGNEEVEMKHLLVRFLDDVEEFLDMEGNEVGPFKKGEVANLERELIDVLKGDGRVEVLDED
jgi:DNA replication initiation complex subunit (GINS family)